MEFVKMQKLIRIILLLECMMLMMLRITASTQEVSVTSTLIRGQFALPGQRVTFTCVARNTTLLEWYSEEYIGPNGDLLPIASSGVARNRTRGTTVATRVGVDIVDGITTIISELHITASEVYPMSSVTCGINSRGPRQHIYFNTTESIPKLPTTTNSELTTVSKTEDEPTSRLSDSKNTNTADAILIIVIVIVLVLLVVISLLLLVAIIISRKYLCRPKIVSSIDAEDNVKPSKKDEPKPVDEGIADISYKNIYQPESGPNGEYAPQNNVPDSDPERDDTQSTNSSGRGSIFTGVCNAEEDSDLENSQDPVPLS